MKFKEYFLLTKTTTKSCLKIISIIFGVIFAVFTLVMKIKDPLSLKDMGQIETLIARFVFIYGITIWIFICAIMSGYHNANKIIKLYDSILIDIKENFYLKLQPKRLNIKYNFLGFEILGLYQNKVIGINILEGKVCLILNLAFENQTNIVKLQGELYKRHKKSGININGYGLVKKIKKKEWNNISVSIIEKYIKEMENIAKIEKYTGF